MSVVGAWLDHMNHPVLSAIAAMHAAFDEIVAVDPIGRAHDPKWDTLHHPDGSTTFTRRVEG